MRKRFFWARCLMRNNGSPDIELIHRFRHMDEARTWVETMEVTEKDFAELIPATHPEVRRIQRRMAQGEELNFPMEIN